MITARTSPPPGDSSSAAIRCIAERGYEATTAEDLAEALGVSRSTFFRRFGGKDDVVFTDHDHALSRLEESLDAAEGRPITALVDATSAVLRLLTRDPEAARLRFELMRRTPALRDRELIITHRYARVYSRYLRRILGPGTPSWVPGALASSIVAVHNSTLRNWLVEDITDALQSAIRDLRQLLGLYVRWLEPAEPAATPQRVVVAVYEAEGSPESVLAAVARELDG